MRTVRFGSDDLVAGVSALFSLVQNMRKDVRAVLDDPKNVFEDDDLFARDVPPLLDACIEELEHMVQDRKSTSRNSSHGP